MDKWWGVIPAKKAKPRQESSVSVIPAEAGIHFSVPGFRVALGCVRLLLMTCLSFPNAERPRSGQLRMTGDGGRSKGEHDGAAAITINAIK